MTKSITMELPDWVNWIAQNDDGGIIIMRYKDEYPDINNSKINLNTHRAYIDPDGILHRCELVPNMLKEQA